MGCQTTGYGSQKLITINKLGLIGQFLRPVTFTYLTINVPHVEHNLLVPSRYPTSNWPPSSGVLRENSV
jgi:hypothetical protein